MQIKKVRSTIEPNEVEFLQGKKIINFNIEEVDVEDEMTGSTHKEYQYEQVKVDVNANKHEIIEAIMASRYSIGAEIALLKDKDNKKEEYDVMEDFRAFAKELASRVVDVKR